MQRQLVLSLFFALSSVHAPAFAEMPICPDRVQEQTVPCRPTATTEILPTCADSIYEQNGKCKPTATTQILPVCPDAIDEQTEACKPTPTTQIKTEIRCIDDDGKAWTKDEVARGEGNFAKHGNDKCWSESYSQGYSHNENSGESVSQGKAGESHGHTHGYLHTESYGESVSSGGVSRAQGHSYDEGCSCSCNENEGETHTSGSGTENG